MSTDIAQILHDIRQADVDELWRGWRIRPEIALANGFENSSEVYTGVTDRPIAMFGVVPESLMTGEGAIWLIGTNEILKNTRLFLSGSKVEISLLMKRYTRLHNMVDSRNRLTVRWLAWLGFAIGTPVPFGPDGHPFSRFEMASNV